MSANTIPSRHPPAGIDVVLAYLANNKVTLQDLPAVICLVVTTFRQIADGTAPAVPVERFDLPSDQVVRASIRPDGIVSFVDGKTYKTLKCHLSANGFDPGSYLKRFGLPPDYPMVAAAYAQTRSELAKGTRLQGGRSGQYRSVIARLDGQPTAGGGSA